MSRIKKLVYLIIIGMLFTQCKPYQVATKPNEMKYTEFTAQQQFWNSPEGKIAYIDKGEGKPLLFLHGVPTSGWLYRKMIDPLVAKGFRVIVPDMLGFGNSESPKGYEIYDKKAHANRIWGLMKHLNIDSWTHIMHDAGGLWTWEMLKVDPDKIEKLIVLNTIIYDEGFEPPVKMKKGFFAKIPMWAYRNMSGMMIGKLFKNGTNDHQMSKAEIEGYTTPLKQGKTQALYKFFTTNTKSIPDYTTALTNLKVPVQVIWGTDDTILLWNPQKEKVTKNLKVDPKDIHLLSKNHFIQEEATDKLIELISSF